MKNKNGFGVVGVILTIVIVLIVVGGLIWMFYGKTIGAIVTIRSLENGNESLLSVTPKPRTLSPLVTPATSSTLAYGGYIFNVPWEGVSSTKGGATPTSSVSIVFTDGNQFSVLSAATPSPQELQDINEVGSLDPSYQIKTQYDLDNAMYNATPGQVNITTPRNDAVLIALLLTLKSVDLTAAGPLYSFDTGTVKGFQLGDPALGKPVPIFCYDSNGNKFTVITSGTQAEIDYILASIKPL
jgi:hypothetical protein